MINYIIIGIVVLLAVFIAGIVVRRKHSTEITRLDQEKMQIQHYPLYEELAKIKALNMNGQTEELFETWRSSWAEVTDVHITKIDSMLFDAEEYIDRFKFNKSKEIQKEIAIKIQYCDQARKKIIAELEELIGSEEKNRIEMEQLRDYYRSARKTILAHQHSFGPALEGLEKKIEAFAPKFTEFDELTEEGNYLQAREIVLSLNNDAQEIYALLTDIPTLLAEVQTKIPGAIHDLRNGQREMEESNYYLLHLELTEYLDKVEDELDSLKQQVADLSIEPVKQRMEQMNGEIDQFYDLLEKEVVARAFVEKECHPLREKLNNVMFEMRELSKEAAYVQHSYRISVEEAEIPKNALKQLEAIDRRYTLLANRVEEQKSAFSVLKEELVELENEIEHIHEEQELFSSRLKNLRIDENKARMELENIRKMLQETERSLQRANIPGIPEEMEARLEEADEQIYIVNQTLQEVPLNIETVKQHISSAKKCVEDVRERANEMVLNVMLIERMIQYGNRYRAKNPKMHQQLLEAEHAFKQFRYIKALEDAGTAIESVEPGALKRIEEIVQEELATKA